jgi:hypothetical protein
MPQAFLLAQSHTVHVPARLEQSGDPALSSAVGSLGVITWPTSNPEWYAPKIVSCIF